MTKPKVENKIMSDEESRKLLSDELLSCNDATLLYSNVEIEGDETHETKKITIPVIKLNYSIENKDAYEDVHFQCAWTSMAIDDGFDSMFYLFLHLDFGEMGKMKFKIDLTNPKDREWVLSLIKSGVSILCDEGKEEKGEAKWDIGLSGIPMDIPMVLIQLSAMRLIKKRGMIGG